jgi:hypothetical protein
MKHLPSVCWILDLLRQLDSKSGAASDETVAFMVGAGCRYQLVAPLGHCLDTLK